MTTGHRWFRGCALGCGVLLLLGSGACVLGILYLGNTFRGIEKASESHDALVGELGTVEDYVPSADGVPGPGRLELFVSIREAISSERLAVDEALSTLRPPELQEGSPVLRIQVGLGALGDLIDGMGGYLQARNQALLERHMSLGEYVYLYTLVYCSWLGHEPGEGPEARSGPDGVRIEVFEGDALFGEAAVRRRYRRYILGMLERQLSAVSAASDETWLAAVREEIRRMEVDPGRVLWRGAVPPPIEVSLKPLRGRMEATWSRDTNRLELPLAEHETPWDWN